MVSCILFLLLSSVAFTNVLEGPLSAPDFQQPPSHLHWKKIETDHFEVIFPEDITREAQRVAFILEEAYPFVTRSLGAYPHKIPLVLHNQSIGSNGFVTLAPRRSEWFVTPTTDPILTNTEWLKTLAIHELRHVVQFQKTRQGVNRYYEMFLGEVGQALGLGLTLPPWFYEGDAVGIETALTRGGRGRLPLFDRNLRALLLSGKKYSYDKAHLGSYEDFIPNHYVYGYFYTSHMRSEFGDLFLSRLVDRASESSYNPFTFYNAARDLTGKSFDEFYREVMANLIAEWGKRYEELAPTPYEVRSLPRKSGWTNYDFPQVVSEGKILALKRGLSHIAQFVIIDGEREETLFYPGVLSNEFPYRLRKHRFAYTEVDLDPRWGIRDFNRLRVFDLNSRSFILDLRKTKLRLPVMSHDGKKIAAIEWSPEQLQTVVVLSLSGAELKRLPLDSGRLVTGLDWMGAGALALVEKTGDEQKRISKLDLVQGTISEIVPPGDANLGAVVFEEGRLLYESPQSGIDNIFWWENGSVRQLTSSRFGAYAPHLANGRLIYNDYLADGMEVVEKELPWNEAQNSGASFYPVFEKFAVLEAGETFAAKLRVPKELEVSDYSQVSEALNLHSWVILAPPLSSTITLEGYSRDVLNKFTLGAGAAHDLNEGTTQGFVTANWQHLYPVFDLRAAYGSRRQTARSGVRSITNKWEEGSLEGGVSVPWTQIQGRFTQVFTVRAFSKLLYVVGRLGGEEQLNRGTLHSPGIEVEFSSLSRLAKRDVFAPWGIVLNGHLEEGFSIDGEKQEGSLRTMDSRFFLPGLFDHQHFFHQLAYERKRDDTYQYASGIAAARGTALSFLNELKKYSANYTLPLANPDVAWGRWVYFRRLLLNGFYDEINGSYRAKGYLRSSAGAELILETNFLRLAFPVQWGIRRNFIISGPEEDSFDIFLLTGLGSF